SGRCPSGHSPSVPSQAQGGAARPETLLASIPISTISSTQLEGRLNVSLRSAPRRPRCKINTKPHSKPNVVATLVAKIPPHPKDLPLKNRIQRARIRLTDRPKDF
ncbi:hypothetical protein QEH56_24340, partial [Pelagicoccus enzymogenes]|uniref:hypothetical protein n=1 Tax=Pelagicoccus enzymogenes TaxID=2773457 RepID=UPI00280F1C6F